MLKRIFTLSALCLLALAQTVWAATTLVVARGNEANSLDPPEALSFEAIKCTDWMYDGLTRFDGNTHKIIPALATSWAMSEDGLTWTFKLRQGVKFHDGTDFNADAVVFNYERQRDPKHPYQSKIFNRWNQKFENVKLTRKIDDYTVEIQLKAPAPSLLANLGLFGGYIVSPTAVMKDKEGFRMHPVGTGYFKFVKWEKDNYIEYEANKDYWDGPPLVDRLVVKVIPDNDVRLLALEKGEVHIAYGVDYTSYDGILKSSELELHEVPTLGVSLVSINTSRKPFDDVRVRQAIIHAVDRERLFQTVFYGYGLPANQTIPPSWFGHNPDVKSLNYDPPKAKKLLAEAGIKNLKLNLISWNSPRPYCPSPRDLATLIKSDLKNVGIDVNIQIMNWNTFFEERAKNNFDMALGGLVSGTPDPDNLLYQLWSADSIRPIDRTNSANWRNAKGDALINEGRSVYDEKKRDAIYKQVETEIDKDSPAIFIAHPSTAVAAQKRVKGLYIHDTTLVPLHKVSLSEK